jgi:glutathione S-transferase
MMKLIHAPHSRSTMVLWALEEAGADYEIQSVTITRPDGSGAQDPSNPHPEKKVPALVHNGVLITETIAIGQYIADLHPASGLAPAPTDVLRGPYLMWLNYYSGVMQPVSMLGFMGVEMTPMLKRSIGDKAMVEGRISDALKANPYIAGDRFTFADIMFASAAGWNRALLPPGDHVDAYIARCHDRPARARAMAKDSAPA